MSDSLIPTAIPHTHILQHPCVARHTEQRSSEPASGRVTDQNDPLASRGDRLLDGSLCLLDVPSKCWTLGLRVARDKLRIA